MKNQKFRGCDLTRQLQEGSHRMIGITQLMRALYRFCSKPKSRKGFRRYLTVLLLFRVVATTYRALTSLLRTLPKLLELTEPLFKFKLLELIQSILTDLF